MISGQTKPISPSRGEVWTIWFHPQVGAEIGKLRPAVVLSLNAIGRLPLRIVVPFTDWKPGYETLPWMINLKHTQSNGLSKESAADAFQVKSVSLQRFDRCIGRVNAEQLDEISQAVAFCIGV